MSGDDYDSEKDAAPTGQRLYSISLDKLLGKNPNIDNTKYTHPPRKRNWLPPPGIPPFVFNQKHISLFLNKECPPGQKCPPEKSKNKCEDCDDDNDISCRKVYCCFQNPGMPCCPFRIQCPVITRNCGENKQNKYSSKSARTYCEPDPCPISPFFNNCNFYNIRYGNSGKKAISDDASDSGLGSENSGSGHQKNRRHSHSHHKHNHNHGKDKYRDKVKAKVPASVNSERSPLGPDLDYLRRKDTF